MSLVHVCDECGDRYTSPLFPWESNYKTMYLCSKCFENRFQKKQKIKLKWWQKIFRKQR